MKAVQTAEEAKDLIQFAVPLKNEWLKDVAKKGILIDGACGTGLIFLILATFHIDFFQIIITIVPFSFAFGAVRAFIKIKILERQEASIKDGSYFLGKSDQDLIREANSKCAYFFNEKKDIEERWAAMDDE